jgi:hypothetical protein
VLLNERTGYVCEIAPAQAAPLDTWQHPARTAWFKVGEKIVGSIFSLYKLLQTSRRADVAKEVSLKILDGIGHQA